MSTRKLFVTLVAVFTLALLAVPMSAAAAPPAQDGEPRTITVTGFGTAYGAPDVARLGLGVDGLNEDILAAMDDVNARMNAVTQALQVGGVAPEDIRTEYFSIYQDYGPYGQPEPGTEVKPSYRVSTSVAVTVRETDNVGELLAAAVSAGANIVNYIQFDIEDRAGLQADARELAVADAQTRAEHLAGILGMSVGEPLQVTEGSDLYGPYPGGYGGGGGGPAVGAAPAISEGQLSVSMSVTITFALQPAQ